MIFKKNNNIRSILKDFYGKSRYGSAVVKHLPKSMNIRDIIENSLEKNPILNNTFRIINENWPKIVREERIYNFSRPIKLSNGELTVEVDNSILLAELKKYSRRMIINNCNSFLTTSKIMGNKIIIKIKFIPRGSF